MPCQRPSLARLDSGANASRDQAPRHQALRPIPRPPRPRDRVPDTRARKRSKTRAAISRGHFPRWPVSHREARFPSRRVRRSHRYARPMGKISAACGMGDSDDSAEAASRSAGLHVCRISRESNGSFWLRDAMIGGRRFPPRDRRSLGKEDRVLKQSDSSLSDARGVELDRQPAGRVAALVDRRAISRGRRSREASSRWALVIALRGRRKADCSLMDRAIARRFVFAEGLRFGKCAERLVIRKLIFEAGAFISTPVSRNPRLSGCRRVTRSQASIGASLTRVKTLCRDRPCGNAQCKFSGITCAVEVLEKMLQRIRAPQGRRERRVGAGSFHNSSRRTAASPCPRSTGSASARPSPKSTRMDWAKDSLSSFGKTPLSQLRKPPPVASR